MLEDQWFKSFTFWQRLIRLGLFVLFVWEIRVPSHLYIIAKGILAFLGNGYLLPYSVVTSLLVLLGWFLLFFTCYAIFIFWLAQFILPVTTWRDRLPAAWRLFLFSIYKKWHGAAVFVRDGKTNANVAELEKNGPGVAFVDLRSAITLNKRLDRKRPITPASLEQPQREEFDPKSNTYVSNVRVAGPGLTFTRRNEKITGAVDLRKQTRSRKDVVADTRDGIWIKTDVSCTFTLGESPDTLDVCLGGEGGKQVFVIKWDDSVPLTEKRIKSLSRGLDEGDEKEIYEFVLSHPDPSTVSADVHNSGFPYTFDEERVEQAVYSVTSEQDPARSHTLDFKKWSGWPQDVAAEKFRIMLAQWPYMKLYSPEDPDNFPLKQFKNDLSRQVRNTGILAYRAVTLQDGGSLEAGRVYMTSELVYYPPRNLIRFDVLRERGIKVLSAGFGELEPLVGEVRDHLVESWRSGKQKEADLKVADSHLEIARIKNHARVRAQQNLIYHLNQVLENQEYPREALAMLIYQELEAAAANPETRKLLPADTLNLLTGIGTLLLPRDKPTGWPDGGVPMVENDQ